MENLIAAELVVILGTKTYGKKTESKFSTFHELKYILDEDKPYFLVKMCDRFEETIARFHFTSTIANYPWPMRDHGRLPPDLMPQIKQKLSKVSNSSLAMEKTKTSTPDADQLARLVEAQQRSDFSAIVQILKAPVNSKVVEEGCRMVKDLAWKNDTRIREFGQFGACEAIVQILGKFGDDDARIAEHGCGATQTLAYGNVDNRKELNRVGACDAVVKALKKFGVVHALVAQVGCVAVQNLVVDGNAKELDRMEACDAVVKALNKFGVENASIAHNGCGAVCNLAANDANNQKELGGVGACDAVVNALKKFGVENAFVAQCGAVGILLLMMLTTEKNLVEWEQGRGSGLQR